MGTTLVLLVSQATGTPWWVLPLSAAASIASAIITGVVALLVLSLTNEAAEKRLEFEREMKLRDDRREAYAKMLRVTKVLEATPPGPPKDVAEAHAEIEILTGNDSIINITGELVQAVGAARQVAWELEQSKVKDPYHEPRYLAAQQRVDKERASFIMLAKDDLGDVSQPRKRSWWRRCFGFE